MEKFKCVICNKPVKPLDLGQGFDDYEFEQNMWDGGTVDKFYMPYGSRFDGNAYYICICDNCLEKKIEEGVIKLAGEY